MGTFVNGRLTNLAAAAIAAFIIALNIYLLYDIFAG
jgi:Mn2+/Fe2+ NRAMP family transporter